MDDHLCTCEEVANILNSKVSTVRTYCKEGKIPAIKVGRGYRVSKRDLENWMRLRKDHELTDEESKGAERYKVLFESAHDAIVICDRTGHINLANPQFADMSGYSLQEAQGLHFSKLIHPDDLAVAIEHFMKSLAGELARKNLEIKFISKDQETLYVSVNTNALYDQGTINGVQMIIRDFTEERKATNKILFFAGMMDQSAEAYLGIDGDRKITYANTAMRKILGYKEEEILGQDIGFLHGTDKVEEEKATITEAVIKKGEWNGEIINKRKNGEKFKCAVAVRKIGDKEGRLIAYTAIIREISKKV